MTLTPAYKYSFTKNYRYVIDERYILAFTPVKSMGSKLMTMREVGIDYFYARVEEGVYSLYRR